MLHIPLNFSGNMWRQCSDQLDGPIGNANSSSMVRHTQLQLGQTVVWHLVEEQPFQETSCASTLLKT